MTECWVEVGRVRSVNTRNREVRVIPRAGYAYVFSALPWVRFRYGAGAPLRCKVLRTREDGDVVIVALSPGVSRDVVGQLRSAAVVLMEEEMPSRPERSIQLSDLVNLKVVLPSGDVLGTVVEVYEGPANDAFAVASSSGYRCILPVIDPVIEAVDLDRNELRVGDITPYVVEE